MSILFYKSNKTLQNYSIINKEEKYYETDISIYWGRGYSDYWAVNFDSCHFNNYWRSSSGRT